MSSIYFIIQARMGSNRLPGKVLRQIDGLPLIDRVVKQVRETKYNATICVATTDRAEDTILSDHCDKSLNVSVFRGDSLNVLKRYWDCYSEIKSKKCGNDVIVRITADDPFKCPELIHDCVDVMLSDESLDYVSNISENGFPVGLDVEVIRARVLEASVLNATTAYDKEHVTQFVLRQPERFKLKTITAPDDYSRFRLTVDYESDVAAANFLAESVPTVFTWKDLQKCLEQNAEYFLGLQGINAKG